MMVDDEMEKAERFQRLFVTPLVEGVRKEIAPIVKGQEDLLGLQKALDARVTRLESKFTRAVAGLSVAAAVFSVAFGIALDWVKKKLGLGRR